MQAAASTGLRVRGSAGLWFHHSQRLPQNGQLWVGVVWILGDHLEHDPEW